MDYKSWKFKDAVSAGPLIRKESTPTAALVYLLLVSQSVAALPLDGKVVAGSANIHQHSATRLDVVQNSQRAAVDWRSFNIGRSEHVNFQQPNSTAATLNRVTGPQASQILGKMTANGRVFLINPNGILFGRNSKIDVGGLVASTTNISNDNFMAGRLEFDQVSDNPGVIINEGEITAADGGLVALVAPGVSNSGVISARLGTVALASGNKFTLDFYGDNLVNFAVNDDTAERLQSADTLNARIEHTGTITADGGSILISASDAAVALGNVINVSGIARAQTVETVNGRIVLRGYAPGTQVRIAGEVDVSGQGAEAGGNVTAAADQIVIASSAEIDATGEGGGSVELGGSYKGEGPLPNASMTVMETGARISADATRLGSGGKVVIFADGDTTFQGTITARGGAESGDGGIVEVSGKRKLTFDGQVDASANNGKPGTLLLDPEKVIVDRDDAVGAVDAPASGVIESIDDPGTTSRLKVSTVNELLRNGTNVSFSATDLIQILGTIDGRYLNETPSGAWLSLVSGGDIILGETTPDASTAGSVYLPDGNFSATAGRDFLMNSGTVLYSGTGDVQIITGRDATISNIVSDGSSISIRCESPTCGTLSVNNIRGTSQNSSGPDIVTMIFGVLPATTQENVNDRKHTLTIADDVTTFGPLVNKPGTGTGTIEVFEYIAAKAKVELSTGGDVKFPNGAGILTDLENVDTEITITAGGDIIEGAPPVSVSELSNLLADLVTVSREYSSNVVTTVTLNAHPSDPNPGTKPTPPNISVELVPAGSSDTARRNEILTGLNDIPLNDIPAPPLVVTPPQEPPTTGGNPGGGNIRPPPPPTNGGPTPAVEPPANNSIVESAPSNTESVLRAERFSEEGVMVGIISGAGVADYADLGLQPSVWGASFDIFSLPMHVVGLSPEATEAGLGSLYFESGIFEWQNETADDDGKIDSVFPASSLPL